MFIYIKHSGMTTKYRELGDCYVVIQSIANTLF